MAADGEDLRARMNDIIQGQVEEEEYFEDEWSRDPQCSSLSTGGCARLLLESGLPWGCLSDTLSSTTFCVWVSSTEGVLRNERDCSFFSGERTKKPSTVKKKTKQQNSYIFTFLFCLPSLVYFVGFMGFLSPRCSG